MPVFASISVHVDRGIKSPDCNDQYSTNDHSTEDMQGIFLHVMSFLPPLAVVWATAVVRIMLVTHTLNI